MCLRHSNQNLIDAKKIAPPNPKPNVTTNPLPNHNRAFLPPNINLLDDMPPFDPSMVIIPSTEPKPAVYLPLEPEVYLIRIPDLESDDDSDSDDTLDDLYHFAETDLKDVAFEWFDPYDAVDNDGWNEMTDTEEEPESEPKTKLVLNRMLSLSQNVNLK